MAKLLLFNGQDLLEITIYKGTKTMAANLLFGLKVGDKIYIQLKMMDVELMLGDVGC